MSMRILIVEDNQQEKDTLTKLLKKLIDHLTIYHACTLAEGIKLSHTVQADITLLDPGLPDVKDYKEVGKAIKEGLFFPPVIITTGMPDPNHEREIFFMRCGAQQVFHKPYVEQVVALIASAATAAAMRQLVATADG